MLLSVTSLNKASSIVVFILRDAFKKATFFVNHIAYNFASSYRRLIN